MELALSLPTKARSWEVVKRAEELAKTQGGYWTDHMVTARMHLGHELKQFPPDLNLRDSQTVSDDGDSVH